MPDTRSQTDHDRELLRRLSASDPAALDGLIESCWDALVGFVLRFTGSLENAEDIAQESFLRLWDGRKKWSASGSPRAVVYRIARNLAVDERRKRLVRDRFSSADLTPPSRPSTPLEDIESSELKRQLEAALTRLPEREREIFLLSRRDGLSHAEIADVMDLRVQSVANLLHGVLKHLRQTLAPFLSTEPDAKVISFPRRQA